MNPSRITTALYEKRLIKQIAELYLGVFAAGVKILTLKDLLVGGHHFNQRRSSDWIVGVRRVRL
jgi:hypothetical protein